MQWNDKKASLYNKLAFSLLDKFGTYDKINYLTGQEGNMTEYVIIKVEKCSQCSGTGEIEFLGNHHAICPKCGGAGESRKTITVEELLKEIYNDKTLS